jgi:Cu(I)/Ag(I) efflux system membrane fusion protein
MANGNQGAVWISTEEGVKNPYFGDTMLTCGSIIETIN